MDSSQLSFFRSADTLNKPPSWPVDDFCTLTLSELKEIQYDDIQVDEIRHYKEIDGLEHEFLVAGVKDGENRYLLRIERSTPARIRRTFWQKLKQTSASILPAFDSVSVSSSFEKLTTDMGRGPIIHIATLPISSAPVTLHDFCLLLSLFPSFSPTYKLKEEQCYWFCNVVFATISSIRGVELDPGAGFKRAGKYGRFSIRMSPEARKTFIEGYKLVQKLQSHSIEELNDVNLTTSTAQALVAMLSVHSEEARTRALLCVASLASKSLSSREQLLDAGVADCLSLIFIPSSTKAKALIFQALDIFGVSDFDPLPNAKLIGKAGHLTVGDSFTEGDRKAVDSQYTTVVLDMIALLKDDRPTVCSWSARIVAKFFWHEKCRPLILDAIPYMVAINLHEVHLTVTRIMTDLAQHSDVEALKDAMARAFPALLSGPYEDVRVASIVSLRSFADRVQLRRQCITVFPLVALLFVNNNDHIASNIDELYFGADDSMKRAETAIASELAKFESDDLYRMGLKAMSIVAKRRICYPIITDNLPRIIELFTDVNERWSIRFGAIKVLYELVPIAKFQPHVEKAIPKVFHLLRDGHGNVRLQYAAEFLIKAASKFIYHSVMLELCPRIIQLLANESRPCRKAAVDVLSSLVATADFQLHVKEAIPKVFELLRDDDGDVEGEVRQSAIQFITRAASEYNFSPIVLSLFPQIVDLLTDESQEGRGVVIDLLSRLAPIVEFRPRMEEIIPQVLCLLNASSWYVLNFIKKILPYFYNHPAVIGVILQLTRFLDDGSIFSRCNNAAGLLCDYMDYVNLRPHIQNIIPEVKKLQSHRDTRIKRSATRIIAKASECGMV